MNEHLPAPNRSSTPPPTAAADEPSVRSHRLAVSRSARYCTLGESGAPGEVWYVLHGYGQLAADFIRPFGELDNRRRLVVAPEGLSRFYLDGAHRRVGASWMTREEREHEIDDYLAYLDALHERVVDDLSGDGPSPDEVRVHVVGFSQGCETAARWAVRGAAAPERLVLWGGRVPEDLNLAVYGDALRRLRLVVVAGTRDDFATPERVADLEERLNRHRIPYELVSFEGGHRLDAEVLRMLAS